MDSKPNEPQPGAPDEKPKPVKVDTNINLAFSYLDLELFEVYTDNGRRFLVFGLNGEYVIVMPQWEYLEWISFIFEEIEFIQLDGGICTCDIVSPDYEIVEENHKISGVEFNEKGEEVGKPTDKFIPVVMVWNLVQKTIVGIHDNDEHKED